MDILLRILTQSLRENQTGLQLSEMRRRQIHMMHVDNWQAMCRERLLA